MKSTNTREEGETVSVKDSKLLIRSLIMSDAIHSRLIRLILALLSKPRVVLKK